MYLCFKFEQNRTTRTLLNYQLKSVQIWDVLSAPGVN